MSTPDSGIPEGWGPAPEGLQRQLDALACWLVDEWGVDWPAAVELVGLLWQVVPVYLLAGVRLRADLPTPSRASLAGLVGAVLTAEDPDGALAWAARRLYLHYHAGHLTEETVATMLGRTLRRLDRAESSIELLCNRASVEAHREILNAVAEDVRPLLDREWLERALQLRRTEPELCEATPALLVALQWTAEREQGEQQ